MTTLRVLDIDGYSLHPAIFTADEVIRLADNLGPIEGAGRRSLLDEPIVQRLALDTRLRAIVGSDFFAVRGLLFDKTPTSNWSLRWHQDVSIAVRARRDVAGFGSWTEKAGVLHATAPVNVLSRMVTLRIHLDDCDADAGPLRVGPGSHLRGRLDDNGIREAAGDERVCIAFRGDVLAFRPLLVHASASSKSASHRRVLQIEFARDDLPGGLEWRWRV